MSRSNYNDECDGWELIRWRGAVASAINGARGQQMLRELAEALDAMPQKRLIVDSLISDGEVCAMGCLGRRRGIDMSEIDPYDPETVAKVFGIAPALAREIACINDDWGYHNTPEERWGIVRRWVSENLHGIRPETPPLSA